MLVDNFAHRSFHSLVKERPGHTPLSALKLLKAATVAFALTNPKTDERDVLTNEQCLEEARSFFKYADIEGYRGSPHKL